LEGVSNDGFNADVEILVGGDVGGYGDLVGDGGVYYEGDGLYFCDLEGDGVGAARQGEECEQQDYMAEISFHDCLLV
jgi:hypothetical protein